MPLKQPPEHTHPVICPVCEGHGLICPGHLCQTEAVMPEVCDHCGGQGWAWPTAKYAGRETPLARIFLCPRCKGNHAPRFPQVRGACRYCQGRGWIAIPPPPKNSTKQEDA